jgi:hypothetical membrane protein
MKSKNILKIISLFGLISVVFYFLHLLLGNIFYEGYNPLSQAISDLTASNSPSRNAALPFSILYGIFTTIFSASLFAYFKGQINKCVTLGLCFFCIMTIVSFIGYTFFPLSESGYAGKFQDKMHLITTIVVVAFTIIAIVLLTIGFFQIKKTKILAIVSLFTLVLLFTGAILINKIPKEYFGVAERINAYSIIIYTGILSLWMYSILRSRKI